MINTKYSIVQPTVAVEAERLVSSIDSNGDRAPRRDRHLQRLRAAGRDVHPALGINLPNRIDVVVAKTCQGEFYVMFLKTQVSIRCYLNLEPNSCLVRPTISVLSKIRSVRVFCWDPTMGQHPLNEGYQDVAGVF